VTAQWRPKLEELGQRDDKTLFTRAQQQPGQRYRKNAKLLLYEFGWWPGKGSHRNVGAFRGEQKATTATAERPHNTGKPVAGYERGRRWTNALEHAQLAQEHSTGQKPRRTQLTHSIYPETAPASHVSS